MTDSVLTEIRGQVGIISLNRPEALNAWNGPLCQALDDALKWASSDDKVRAVVITGVGKAFCAGADLSGGSDTFVDGGSSRSTDDDVKARTPKFLPWDVPKPVIAAINGHAVGVGATYALACDIRVIARSAKLAFVFARRGMLAELGSHAILPRVVGLSNASDLLLSGRAVQGEEAASLGLASACVDADLVLDLAVERAQEMAALSAPVSMAISKRLLWESMGLEEMRAAEEPLFDWVAGQADSVEGVVSFLEKRPPKWNLSASNDFPHEFFS